MFEMEGDHNVNTLLDIATPRNSLLSAFYKRSFAYDTVKDRLPTILTQIIDTLARHKSDVGSEFGEDAKEELKIIIGELSKLKYEIQTNKAIRTIKSSANDAKYYNEYLIANPDITYFTAVWLFTESYMYRRIQEMCELSTHLKNFDCFQIQKRESYKSSQDAMEQLSLYLLLLINGNGHNLKEAFIKLLKLNLWGNKADLSFSSGRVERSSDPFDCLQNLEPNILCNDSNQIWEAVSNMKSKSQIIDIILDNAGYEVFTDLCVADFILTNDLAKNIRLYVKTCPYFMSDVTRKDLNWTLKEMQKSSSDVVQILGERWTRYIKNNQLHIVEDDYWTTALDYSVMKITKPDLYKELSESKLIIFKGDLNYRKLIGEKNWDPTTSFEVGLQGFKPTKLCSLRTLKCDIVCGLEKDVVETVTQQNPDWMTTGNYGVIQFAN